MSSKLNIDYLVFAGGGCRTVWQLGFLKSLQTHYTLDVKQIAAVSAGSYMACIFAAGLIDKGLDYFKQVTTQNEKNAYWKHLFTKEAVFPHTRLYRQGVMDLFNTTTFKTLQEGPEILLQSAMPPDWLKFAIPGLLLGLVTYNIDKILIGDIHRRLGKKIGFKTLVMSSKKCNSAEHLAEMILKSSCSPPFTPVLREGKRAVLDGGIVDNVPLDLIKTKCLSHEKVLILLTRKYNKPLPKHPNYLYVQPSNHPAVKRWDYTSPTLIEDTFAMGIKDGENFIQSQLPNYTLVS